MLQTNIYIMGSEKPSNLNEKERFLYFVNHNGGYASVSEKSGVSIQRMSNYARGEAKTMGSDAVGALMKHYPDFNTEWWLTGKGEYQKITTGELAKFILENNPQKFEDLKTAYKLLGQFIDSLER